MLVAFVTIQPTAVLTAAVAFELAVCATAPPVISSETSATPNNCLIWFPPRILSNSGNGRADDRSIGPTIVDTYWPHGQIEFSDRGVIHQNSLKVGEKEPVPCVDRNRSYLSYLVEPQKTGNALLQAIELRALISHSGVGHKKIKSELWALQVRTPPL